MREREESLGKKDKTSALQRFRNGRGRIRLFFPERWGACAWGQSLFLGATAAQCPHRKKQQQGRIPKHPWPNGSSISTWPEKGSGLFVEKSKSPDPFPLPVRLGLRGLRGLMGSRLMGSDHVFCFLAIRPPSVVCARNKKQGLTPTGPDRTVRWQTRLGRDSLSPIDPAGITGATHPPGGSAIGGCRKPRPDQESRAAPPPCRETARQSSDSRGWALR